MARYNFLASGYPIVDEVINRSSSTAAKIGHDLFIAPGFEIWTGASKTGTKLTHTTDYYFSTENTDYTAKVGTPVYMKVVIINGAYQNMNLYQTYTTVGDLSNVENIIEMSLENISQANFASDSLPLDADEVLGFNSSSSFSKIRTSWTNIKAFLKTYFDTLYGDKNTNGTYTPTGYDSTNLSAVTFSQAYWTRSGDIVDVDFSMSVDIITANVNTYVSITLPTSPNLGNASELTGMAVSTDGSSMSAYGDATNNVAVFSNTDGWANTSIMYFAVHLRYKHTS